MRTKKRYTKKQRKQRKAEIIRNKHLCKRYPFLIPRQVWTGKVVWKVFHDKYTYPYCYTELDDMEDGWRAKFGIQMCEEIRQELVKYNFLYNYRILEIKEKFGELRWYNSGIPKGSKIWDIINKYTLISRQTCLRCGAPAKIVDFNGWLTPLCDKCQEKMNG